MPPLQNNISAVANAIGVSNVGLVWGLGNIDWPSEEERDNFLRALLTQNNGAG